jgi:hypothetical protein
MVTRQALKTPAARAYRQFHKNLGAVYLDLGNVSQSAHAYTEALRLDPRVLDTASPLERMPPPSAATPGRFSQGACEQRQLPGRRNSLPTPGRGFKGVRRSTPLLTRSAPPPKP